jgi:uncharacterized protein
LTYWPFWLGGLALAGAAVVHWFLVGRMLAVSGRITLIVNRFRFGNPDPGLADMTAADLAEALRQATAAEFGPPSANAPPVSVQSPDPPDAPALAPLWGSPPPFVAHVLFFAGLAAGGLLSSYAAGGGAATAMLHGETFTRLVGGSPVVSSLLLLTAGVCIGFGTRMAGGCTSGHGLCGVSRFQPGSMLTTATFFGVGVISSLVAGRFL